MRSLLLWVSENDWCRDTFPRYGFVKRAVRRFMPGEHLEDALAEAARLRADHGIPALVTFLGENVADEAEARAVADHYVGAVEAVSAKGLDAEISIKPTHVGLDLGHDVAYENIVRITESAEAAGNWVWLDMEYSRYVDPTLDLYRAVKADHANFGICLQSYLHRTPADLESLLPLGPGIRLVKGAYAEPPELAIAREEGRGRGFLRAVRPDAPARRPRGGAPSRIRHPRQHPGAAYLEVGR